MADERVRHLEAFLPHYTVKSFRKGEIIIFQGEAPRSAYVIKGGIVKSYNLSANGDEKPIGFHTSLSVLPVAWVYEKVSSAMYYYEAFTDVELYAVPREEYVSFIGRNPALLFAEFNKFVDDSVGQAMRLNALQHSRASDKLIYTLHYLCLSHGRTVDPHVIEIQLELTHQDFANLTGLTRETTATELNKLKSLGIISYGKHTLYRVQLNKLTKVLNDEFLAELNIIL
jgi:CRP/FNR family transcriptional regulator